jgi:hypothetical protein
MKEKTMRLNDALQICLLSLASRYPVHTLDLDNELIKIPGTETRRWTAYEMIGMLSFYAPQLLEAPACLVIDACCCEIFLPLYSEERPAIHVHCRGKIPALSEKPREKREKGYSSVVTV